jgi:hypothetical protein
MKYKLCVNIQYKSTKSAATKCKREVAVLCNPAVTLQIIMPNDIVANLYKHSLPITD